MAGALGCRSLVVAVTGHTRVENEPAVRSLVNRALRVIHSAADNAVAEHCQQLVKQPIALKARPYVISCLAAGADQIVASEAVKLDYRLIAVLPGAADD